MKYYFFSFLLVSMLIGLSAHAEIKKKQEKQNLPPIGIYENLGAYIPQDIMVYNTDSQLVNLKSLIDKPTVLVLVYYTCPGICSPLLDGVADVISKMDLELGKDYQVLTVSFNSDETPSLAKSKRKNYLKQITKEVDQSAWQWFTADSSNIARLTEAVGFRFRREGKDFIHAASLIALSPEGKITRYLYGTEFLPFDLKMAMIEAAKGQPSPTINKVLQYCFSYDPEGKKYVFNITKVTGTIVLLFALILFLILTLKKRKTTVNEQA